MAITDDGQLGEKLAFNFFWEHGKNHTKCFQIDLMVYDKKHGDFIVEVKFQDIFVKPPFDGHGLSPTQVKARLDFYDRTKIPCLFLVFDKNKEYIYYQWLHILEQGNKFTTKGKKIRTIYDINNFNKKKWSPNLLEIANDFYKNLGVIAIK